MGGVILSMTVDGIVGGWGTHVACPSHVRCIPLQQVTGQDCLTAPSEELNELYKQKTEMMDVLQLRATKKELEVEIARTDRAIKEVKMG